MIACKKYNSSNFRSEKTKFAVGILGATGYLPVECFLV